MSKKKSWIVSLGAAVGIFLVFQVGCSADSDNGLLLGEPGVSGGEAISANVGSGGVGGALTSAVVGGSTAVTNAVGAGGAVSNTPSAAGKGVVAGASGKTTAAGGKSAAGASGKGTAGASGKAGQGGGRAGTESDPCGANAKTVTGTTQKTGNGAVYLYTSGENEVVKLTTTMIVPKEPQPKEGTLFLWPGLEPLSTSSTYRPVGLGVLQPVLTWGTSCAPGGIMTYDTWWIAGMYVNTNYLNAQYSGCKGGGVMKVAVGDKLDIEMILNGTTWTQIVTNQSNGNSVDFDIDLAGQWQQWVLFAIESTASQSFQSNVPKPTDDVIFTSSVIKFSEAEPDACLPGSQGSNDYYSPPRVSSDGKTCCISKNYFARARRSRDVTQRTLTK